MLKYTDQFWKWNSWLTENKKQKKEEKKRGTAAFFSVYYIIIRISSGFWHVGQTKEEFKDVNVPQNCEGYFAQFSDVWTNNRKYETTD